MRITAAVVREAAQPFILEELELDAPGDGEILVKVHSSGICHTDIGVRNQWLPVPLPLVLGHEGAGVVEAVGAGVTKVTPGDKVVLTYAACHECVMCKRGEPAYCEQFALRNVAGSRPDGTNALHGEGDIHGFFFSQSSFGTYAIAVESNVVKVSPDADLSIVGPLGCGIQTGAGTVLNRLNPPAGSSLVVFGAGAVGLAALMAAKVTGCTKIIAVDLVDARLKLAEELGATHTINGGTTDVVDEIRKITGRGADYAVDTTAVTPVVRQAVSALAPKGTCAILGFGTVGTNIEVDMLEFLMAGRNIVGVTEGDARPEEFIPRLIELHAQGRFPYDKLITSYSFKDINTACEDSEAGKTIKPVLQMI
ncbi:NAD(P)-dependent alcohol dehydrogenase [Actinacidiphila oryziradicis]|uniref:NAD(P)-dependent alcohol dehydrogenase n=1 Tax=Actinacidiphila oryziradicis TaxID=2571141 RepID=A0A4U0RXF3_9ACTN|nr:NAD(P)-dependent alcohol dehydrogenase [Actinacidiphila oryziradicis]TKA01036.1 NAD(P)-dependent alcohol dehydrogenase [Actinacidiphila oryziradicis]TKA04999.1 NAD(P)-dependent alcohol dehydrogenase [Actinacidiphila oryziradicis]